MASKDWVRFNEDSRATANREAHVRSHGGEFTYRGKSRGWHWTGTVKKEVVSPKPDTVTASKKKTSNKK
tara:strand:+ start:502 stop:708 length:207 start_codon:yes stop_codon:yes gene_type:complete